MTVGDSQIVTVLGDSRAFDTYYTNSRYDVRYGYDRTFPHIWRKSVLTDPAATYDIVHIPDHFRGGTLQNNIVRVALTNPLVLVVLDGIWETLVNKGHYLDYARRKGLNGEGTYDRSKLAALFCAGELSPSPADYARRQRRLISYFRRRRRHIVWMTLPVPPKDYIGSTYHAGDYQPVPDWDECLRIINDTIIPVAEAYGCAVLDMTKLMAEAGGPRAAFIDQWHFSESFHVRIAAALDALVRKLLPNSPGPDHVSHRYMLGAPSCQIVDPDVVIYDGSPDDELRALRLLPPEKILLYRSELEEIDNPRGDDRAEFEKQAER